MIKENLFFEWVDKNNKKLKLKWKILILLLSLLLFIFSFYSLFQPINYSSTRIFTKNLKELFTFSNYSKKYPSWTLWQLSWYYMFLTIRYCALGTTLGFIFAFFTSFVSSNFQKYKFIRYIINIIIIFFKAFPISLFVYFFSIGFDKELAATLILFWFSWLWMHKYFLDFLNNLDKTNYKIMHMKTNENFASFRKTLFPYIVNKYFMFFVYSLESNIRWTTIINAAGVIGIGLLLNDARDFSLGWSVVGIPLLVILVTIIFFEFLTLFLNKVILNIKNINYQNTSFLWIKLNFRRIFKWFFVLFFVGLNIYSIIKISSFTLYPNYIKNFWNHFFSFQNEVFSHNKENNPFYWILILIYQCIVSITIIAIISLVFSILGNEKLNNVTQWIPLRFLNTLFRIIPTIIFIYLFSIFWIGTNIFLLVAVITALRKSTSLVKQLNESINSINWEIYKTLEIQGKSKFQRIIKFVFPSIKKDYLSFLLFYFENQVQTLILLGSVGGSLLGSKISIVGQAGERTENILELMTYSWISWVFIAIIQLLQFYFNLIVQNKKISQLYLIKNLNTYFTKIKVIFKNKFSSDQ